MKYHMIAALALTVAACGGGNKDAARADSLQRDLAMAPADTHTTLNDAPAAQPAATTPAPQPATPAPAARKPATPRPQAVPSSLAAGTTLTGSSADSLNSRTDHAGRTIQMRVGEAVKDPQGRTVIPAGAMVTLHVDLLAPAENDNDHTGKLRLTPTAVDINGTVHALTGQVDSVKYVIHPRGVTAGDAAKVGAGAVVGGIAGRLIGGNKQSTIAGAVVGGVAGAAVASKTNDRDVVIRPGDYIRIVLTGAFAP